MADKDGKMFMTRSFNVTTEQHLITCSDKYVAYVSARRSSSSSSNTCQTSRAKVNDKVMCAHERNPR